MSKHDKAAQEKVLRNEIYALKFKKKDRTARKQEKKLAIKAREARLETQFQTLEAKRRDWPAGHPNA